MRTDLTLDGTWFPPGTSRAVAARLHVPDASGTAARIETTDGETHDAHVLRISDRIGSSPRRIDFADGGSFSTVDHRQVDAMTGVERRAFSRVFDLERSGPRLIVFALAAVLLIVGLVRYGLPLAAAGAAWATPDTVTAIIDRSGLATLDRFVLAPSRTGDARKARLRDHFDELAAAGDVEATLSFRRGDALGANALALPAGTVVVTDELLTIASDEEVVAVLAHEIAHVRNRHSLQQLYRAAGFAGLVTLIAGDVGAISEELVAGGGFLIAMAASREMELDADATAVDLLRRTGRNPDALRTALDKLYATHCGATAAQRASCEKTGWFASHPGGEERRQALRERIDASR